MDAPALTLATPSAAIRLLAFRPLQASSFPSRLAHPRRPNRVHGGSPHGKPVLRTGRSRCVALHPVLPRRSDASIPHGSSPHGSGLPPLRLPAFSGARRDGALRCPRPQSSGRNGFAAGRGADGAVRHPYLHASFAGTPTNLRICGTAVTNGVRAIGDHPAVVAELIRQHPGTISLGQGW